METNANQSGIEHDFLFLANLLDGRESMQRVQRRSPHGEALRRAAESYVDRDYVAAYESFQPACEKLVADMQRLLSRGLDDEVNKLVRERRKPAAEAKLLVEKKRDHAQHVIDLFDKLRRDLIKHPGENVQGIEFFRPVYHATLMADQIRSNKKYFFYKEMNGQFVIESQDRITDPDTECDYAFVHFFLPLPSPLVGGSVNVFGALTGWNANQSNQMKWNFEQAGYDLTLMLKHGYYNYQYVYVPDGSKKADSSNLEGSHFETENEYQIFAYFHDISSRYDRLVGFVNINSLLR
jgi:hypothetical protein